MLLTARLLATTTFLIVCLFLGTAALAESVTVRSGSVVVIQTTRAYSSETARTEELVDLIVASDVIVNGKIAIRQGTPVSASIEDLDSTQMLGREGRISVTINSTSAVDGTTVPLSGRLSSKGSDEMTGTVVGAFFCPLFLLNKGGEAVIAAGAQGRGIVLGDVIVNVDLARGA